MLHPLPTDWHALIALVFALGLRHGLDADPIATLDGMTRIALRCGRRGARWCGLLFAAGPGCAVGTMVAAAALAMSPRAASVHPPST